MQTIKQAFDAFLKALELTSSESTKASDQHTNMRTQLQKRLVLADNFLSGSYARNTAIRPLNDIDVFLVLKETETLSRDLGTGALLQTVEDTLEDIYPGKTSRRQARSINIEFTGTGISYDVVPAFANGDDVYVIPDSDAGAWIETNPKTHKTLSTQANAACQALKPLLKALKHSNHVHGKLARSFHLEVLSWGILTSDPGTYLEGLTTLLDGLAKQICDPCPDPAGLGPEIQPSSSRCIDAKQWLDKMAALAREASEFTADGKLGEAHANMREIFGPEWPEKGSKSDSKRGAPAIVVGGGAVDDTRSRFG